jgi:hypothetical protein
MGERLGKYAVLCWIGIYEWTHNHPRDTVKSLIFTWAWLIPLGYNYIVIESHVSLSWKLPLLLEYLSLHEGRGRGIPVLHQCMPDEGPSLVRNFAQYIWPVLMFLTSGKMSKKVFTFWRYSCQSSDYSRPKTELCIETLGLPKLSTLSRVFVSVNHFTSDMLSACLIECCPRLLEAWGGEYSFEHVSFTLMKTLAFLEWVWRKLGSPKLQCSTEFIFGSPAGSLCNHVTSVSRARFVTAGAIDPKLSTYVPLGKSNSQTKFRSSLILSLSTRGPKPRFVTIWHRTF